MVSHLLNGTYSDSGSQVYWEDGERVFRRGWRLDGNGTRRAVLIVLPAAEHPSRSSLDRLTHEYQLKDELDVAWAARPLDLVQEAGGTSVLYISAVPFEQIGLRTNIPHEPLPETTWRVLELVPDIVSTGSVLLGGIWWITNRREEVAKAEGRRK